MGMWESTLYAVGLGEHPDRAPRKRSKDWPKVRKAHLAKHPRCEVCGQKKNVEVHHIIPFHVAIETGRPELELDESNLISLCDGPGISHHLLCGHLENYQSWNPECWEDVKILKNKILNRPNR